MPVPKQVLEAVLFFLANTEEGNAVLAALAAFCVRFAMESAEREAERPAAKPQEYPIVKC